MYQKMKLAYALESVVRPPTKLFVQFTNSLFKLVGDPVSLALRTFSYDEDVGIAEKCVDMTSWCDLAINKVKHKCERVGSHVTKVS